MEVRGSGEIGVGVHRDVDAVGPGAVDHREQFVRPAAVDLVAEMGVREVQRHARTPRDLDRVLVRLERVESVVPVVRTVEAAVVAHRLAEGHELEGLSVRHPTLEDIYLLLTAEEAQN